MTVKDLETPTPAPRPFEPAHYLMQIDGRDYLEVKWRLVWLRAEHPTARISTRLVRQDDGFALFRAQVTLPNGASATGWGSETSGDFADYIEAAETKALGRALAALGFGTQFTRDYDFAEVAQAAAPRQVVDSPVSPPQLVGAPRQLTALPSSNNGNGHDNGAGSNGYNAAPGPVLPALGPSTLTEKQLKAIYAIGRAAQHLSEEDVDARSQAQFGCRPADLSRLEASQFIDLLKGTQAA